MTRAPTRRDGVLRAALAANAAFSLVCGAALLAVPSGLAGLLGVAAGPVLSVLGVLLLAWATIVGWQARRRRISTALALGTAAADDAWVLATVVGLVGWGELLAPEGAWLVAGVGAAVGGLAAAQLVGIRRIHAETDPDADTSWRHCVPVEVDVAPEAMWSVVADLGGIERFMPGLARSEADGSAAPGTTRRCADTSGRTWRETCVALEPGRSLTLRFHADDEGFPFPVTAMTGGWVVEPTASGCRVEVWWSFEPRFRTAALFVVPLLASVLDREISRAVERMAGAAAGDASPAEAAPARLAPAC